MGGANGSFAKVDRATTKVFYSIGIADDKRDTTQSGFHLHNDKINCTTVTLSTDRGETWSDAKIAETHSAHVADARPEGSPKACAESRFATAGSEPEPP